MFEYLSKVSVELVGRNAFERNIHSFGEALNIIMIQFLWQLPVSAKSPINVELPTNDCSQKRKYIALMDNQYLKVQFSLNQNFGPTPCPYPKAHTSSEGHKSSAPPH